MFPFKGIPSISNIFLSIFIAYLSYSLWSMIQLFIPPKCIKAETCLKPFIEDNPKFKLLAYTSIAKSPKSSSDISLIYEENPFLYDEEKEKEVNISLPIKVRSNGTMYLHLFLTSIKVDSKNWGSIVNNQYSVYAMTSLTKYQIPEAASFSLLGDSKQVNVTVKGDKKSSVRPVTHFVSQVVYNLLTQPVPLPQEAVPYEIGRSMRLTSKGKYLPVLHIDQLSQRAKHLVEITPEMNESKLILKYAPISYGKMRMWIQFEGALDSMIHLGFSHKDIDEVKGVFSDSNHYLLLITFLVATFHLVFDFLAFKNDISFWRDLENMGGISTSTVVWRSFAQIVIFVYLMEEETSLLVLIPAGVGAIIELWKVTKAFHIKRNGWKVEFNSIVTKEESQTKALDSEGLRYLSYIMYPLCLGGAVYSLLYLPHKSWFSWIINSLVNGVYAFGFLFMLPQLFINYKLKSVAHLPWRAFMYKAFNTFIDDLFAFIITMPTAHRVACFRDDIVFLIYLYQRWLYPVDKKRVNEFGQSGEEKPKKE